ncbi:hypothetical protein V8D89_008534 [Ganoderma adspersum]
MSSTLLPEDVIRSLSRFLFACIPPGQAVVQLFDPNHGDLYLVKGSDDSESPQSPPSNMFSELGLRSPPEALLTELVESLRFAIQDDRRHSTATPSAVGTTLSTLTTDMSEMSFADPGPIDSSGALSDLRGHALFFGVEGTAEGTFSPLPPVSPTPHRSGSPLRLHGDSHPSDGDASSSSIEGTAGSIYSQPDDGQEVPYVTCASIPPGSFTSEGSPILCVGVGAGDRSASSPSPSPLKLFGLSSLPTGFSSPADVHGTPSLSFRPTGNHLNIDSLRSLSASRLAADFSHIGFGVSPSPIGKATTSTADFRAAYSPTTSTPVRDAMRRALAVMIMHRGNSPQLHARSTRRDVRSPSPLSPLSRAELVSLPTGEAAARIVAAVKAREQERTRAWAAAQASRGAAARYLDVAAGAGVSGSESLEKSGL